VFSWSQARFNLPGWYGVGSAFEEVCGTNPALWDTFEQAASKWPFLSYLLHNVEFSTTAADAGIMTEYAMLVEDQETRGRILGQIQVEYERTKRVLERFYPGELATRRPRLVKAIAIRANALVAMHREQIRILQKRREAMRAGDAEEADRLLPSLLVTVNAIASGLKATG
jgi:phosphoenolpyruvate carboxylase